MKSLDTKVEGDPARVTSAATWLRGTLAPNLQMAAEDQQDARTKARGCWEGEAASSYQNFAGSLLRATDKHEDRVKRAATSLDQYAAKLQRCLDAMSDIRRRARRGGLVVAGTLITPPPTEVTGPFASEAAQQAAVTDLTERITLWNTLVRDAAEAYQTFTDWVVAEMPGDVADARRKDATDSLLDTLEAALPNFAAGVGGGLAGLALTQLADDYRAAAAEFRRRSRVAGDPRIRGSADTPAGKSTLDDLLKNSKWLGRGGRFLSGPGGILIDVGFGVYEGTQTGDWTRVVLTTGASVAVGAGIGLAVAAGVVTAPAWAVVLAGGALAAGVGWGVGAIYDNWDDITDWSGDTWDGATDAIGGAWDAVTPW